MALPRRGAQKGRAADQWPVGGMTEVVVDSLIRFAFFAACFSFNVLPCFLALPLWGDLSAMTALLDRRPPAEPGSTARSAGCLRWSATVHHRVTSVTLTLL